MTFIPKELQEIMIFLGCFWAILIAWKIVQISMRKLDDYL